MTPARLIRTRWLVVLVVAVVAAIGALVYTDETDRSEAGLDDLGQEQATVAQAAALADASPAGLAALVVPGRTAVLVQDAAASSLHAVDHAAPITSPPLAAAIARGATTLKLARDEAPALGLPERTAMVGLARTPAGRTIAIAASAEHQRDRDRAGRMRVLLAMLLAAVVMSAFTLVLWRDQRREHALARDLALDRASRAATMAALGSGIAHELATPLGVIAGRAEQLLARVAGDERAEASARAILDQTAHIDEVSRGLLALARGASLSPGALVSVSAHALVADVAELVEHRFARAGVALAIDVAPDLPLVRCEPRLFGHALVNLLLNACDAAPAKSTVRLEVRGDARELAFVVSDAGHGITAEVAARATRPFFTTKPAGQGTGLGLAIANEIAKIHRGALALASRAPAPGTRASITIPVPA